MDSWVAAALCGCLLLFLGVTVVVVGFGVGRSRTDSQSRAARARGIRRVPTAHRAFPLATQNHVAPLRAFPVTSLAAGNIRRYRIVGVDSESRADLDFHIDAATAANAKVKAELAGVIVTEVVEAASPPQPPTT